MSATWVGSAWSCTVRLVVLEERALGSAVADLQALLGRVDAAASRFRPDSALSIANARAGRPTPIPRLLVDLVAAALDAAAQTDGAVDPTVGRAMIGLGYDRDIAAVRAREPGDAAAAEPDAPGEPDAPAARAPDWRAVRLHRETGLLRVPLGTSLDLGATAKAWTADHAARTLSGRYGTGVLVELGGDLAVAGTAPDGWCIRVAERAGGEGQLVRIRGGGVATSTSTLRTWRRAGRLMHHIVDPATGQPADGPWRTVTVAAASALAANTASTAAIVRGDQAAEWLREHRLAARLVGQDGSITTTPGWPVVDRVRTADAEQVPTADVDQVCPGNGRLAAAKPAISREKSIDAAPLAGAGAAR
ncbi:MAG TPA: FAD:protein FMN transferase [Jatrophihabitans sp.]|nr:FAD:protein FMN transferase [Jatrophihabitans sp.]